MSTDSDILAGHERQFQQQDLSELRQEVQYSLRCSVALTTIGSAVTQAGISVSESLSGLSATAVEVTGRGYGGLFMALGGVSLSWAISDFQKFRERESQIY